MKNYRVAYKQVRNVRVVRILRIIKKVQNERRYKYKVRHKNEKKKWSK